MRFTIVLLVLLMGSCASDPDNQEDPPIEPSQAFDWQGHRGCRGLLPENTLLAFTHALDFPAITTLEMDVVINGEGQAVVSHEPWMSETICSHPDGRPVTAEDRTATNIYTMTYAQIRGFDCGRRGNPKFPEQQKIPAVKPTLRQIFDNVKRYCELKDRSLPNLNIELKSKEEMDSIFQPVPEEFVRIVLQEVDTYWEAEHTILQSFDLRILKEIHQQNPNIQLSLLSESRGGLSDEIAALGFIPAIYSPYHLILTEEVIAMAHDKGMRVIPWTVNEPSRMEALITMGVDGIITDYPNRIPDQAEE